MPINGLPSLRERSISSAWVCSEFCSTRDRLTIFLLISKGGCGRPCRILPWKRSSQKTGVRIPVIRDLARRFSRAQKPLALAEGLGLSGPHALDAAVAANLLCLIKPGS